MSWWVGFGIGRPELLGMMFLWGPALLVTMLQMAWQVATGEAQFSDRPIQADD